jgi:hypothetical protein
MTETRVFLGFVRRVVLLSEEITKAAATIEKQAAQIETLKEQVRILQTAGERQEARLEAIALEAAARVSNDLARRVGFLEGRASRE